MIFLRTNTKGENKMIVNPQLVKRVRDFFDLNIYEAKIWMALLSKGVVSAGEAAELSGVPRSRTYDVLESLARRGFAIVKLGKPVKYIAVEPKNVIEKMKNQAVTDAQERVKTLSKLPETSEYVELEMLHKNGVSPVKAEELSGHIRGRPNIIAKIRELMDGAQKEISICTSVIDFEDKARVILPAIERLAKKNVKMKIALSGDDDKIKRMNNKYDLKAKKTENNGRFFISDKSETIFMINHENGGNEVAVWLKSPFFSQTLASMFDEHLRR